MYSISQVSQMFNIPVSTLRYYDNQGLFPGIIRQSGFRRFGESELEALRVIECLKKSGLEIKDIRRFMQRTTQGAETYGLRHEMMLRQKAVVEAEIANMQKALDMLKFKCWYYETAAKQGNEDNLTNTDNPDMPPHIRQAYINAHK